MSEGNARGALSVQPSLGSDLFTWIDEMLDECKQLPNVEELLLEANRKQAEEIAQLKAASAKSKLSTLGAQSTVELYAAPLQIALPKSDKKPRLFIEVRFVQTDERWSAILTGRRTAYNTLRQAFRDGAGSGPCSICKLELPRICFLDPKLSRCLFCSIVFGTEHSVNLSNTVLMQRIKNGELPWLPPQYFRGRNNQKRRLWSYWQQFYLLNRDFVDQCHLCRSKPDDPVTLLVFNEGLIEVPKSLAGFRRTQARQCAVHPCISAHASTHIYASACQEH